MSTSNPSPIIIAKSPGIIQRGGPRIPGILPSVRYGEQVVSTGIPSLDSFIGGGIPLGSICIIKDSFPSRYSNCILKTFIAEGATYNHHIYIACGLGNSESLINDLPSTIWSKKSDESGDHLSTTLVDSENSLKIAWRYGHQLTQGGVAATSKEITKFEFSKKTTASELGARHVVVSQLFENEKNLNPVLYNDILEEITRNVKDFEVPGVIAEKGMKPPSNILRICLSHCEEQVLSPGFMSGLRALVQHTNSCALITISDVAGTTEKIFRLQHLADYVIALQAVADEKRRTDLGDIDGICDIIKIKSIKSLKPVEPPRDLGFSFKKKRLLFHELHLPPEGENTTQREISTRPITSSQSSNCGITVKGKSIDF